MAPVFLHGHGQQSLIAEALSGTRPAEEEHMSKAGNEVAHADTGHLIMFVGIFLVPVLALLCVVGAYAVSRLPFDDVKGRLRDIMKLKRQKSTLSRAESLEIKADAPDPQEEIGCSMTIEAEALKENGLKQILCNKMNVMLIFVPLGFLAHFLHWGVTVSFLINCAAMLPLAGLMGVATEELACHTGQTVGGLLNATFGNAVELIFVVQSLRSGLITITKGTLLGSILANELLVLGMALLFGGLFDKNAGLVLNKQQPFSYVSAMIQAQLLIFSSFTICMPSMFDKAYMIDKQSVLHLSRMGSVFALLGYAIFMVFSLYTHVDMLRDAEADEGDEEEEEATISVPVGMGLLTASTVLVAIMSEFLVHGIDGFAHEMGFSQTFIGVILLPIIGNACEHSTAVLVALKDKVTLSIGIAIGSTIQVALFVVPFAVIVGWLLDQPMDLDFRRLNSWALLLSSLLVMSVLVVGKSTWMNGVVLIAAYFILSFLYFLSPDDALA